MVSALTAAEVAWPVRGPSIFPVFFQNNPHNLSVRELLFPNVLYLGHPQTDYLDQATACPAVFSGLTRPAVISQST